MTDELEAPGAPGFVEERLGHEFPGLRLTWSSAAVPAGNSPPEVRRRLRALSSRYRGLSVIAMRTQPIPHAYRAFFRHIGLDPDVTRIPSEEVAVARLLQGHLVSLSLIEDALLIALVETGVPVWALDAERVAGELGIRVSTGGERLGIGEDGVALPAGRLVVADSECVHALLFGEIAPGHAADARTERAVLFTVGVAGVPAIHLEEALWTCAEVLASARGTGPARAGEAW